MAMPLHTDWHKTLSGRAITKSFAAGETISFQGETAETIGIVLSGRAKAVSYSEGGDEIWLGYFGEDEFFGHISFLTNMPVNFELTAETDLRAMIIPVSAITDFLKSDSSLGEAFARDLAVRLDSMMQRLIEALTLSARGRVCAELIRLSNPIGIDPGKHIIRPNPVFVELASRVNSTRETVSRTVSELQKKGIITREPGSLVIQYPDRLRAAVR